jgi:Phage integrase, N-terminal SAM-like domain
VARVRKTHYSDIEALIGEIWRPTYSVPTEQAYQQWVCRFIVFFNNRDLRKRAAAEVRSFLEHLAVKGNVAACTQNQALKALVFLVFVERLWTSIKYETVYLRAHESVTAARAGVGRTSASTTGDARIARLTRLHPMPSTLVRLLGRPKRSGFAGYQAATAVRLITTRVKSRHMQRLAEAGLVHNCQITA